MAGKLIWALTDGRPGNNNQTLAVAEKLGNYQVIPIEFGLLAKLPNCLLGSTLLGVTTKIQSPYPDIVIAAGRKLSRISRHIKKKSGCKIFQLMWPGYGHQDFDIIFAPEHDSKGNHNNVIETIGPPNRITPALLKTEAQKWKHLVKDATKPVITVLVGNLTVQEAFKLAYALEAIDANLLITTSRRTDAKILKILYEKITHPKHIYELNKGTENPYLGFLGLANYIVVTPDSISMMAEAGTTGKPLFLADAKIPAKHQVFADDLTKMGIARPLINHKLENYNYKPLSTLDGIISAIREKI